MSTTITIVLTDEDGARLQAAVEFLGQPDATQVLHDRINQSVWDYESGLVSTSAYQGYMAAINAQSAAFIPPEPTITITPDP